MPISVLLHTADAVLGRGVSDLLCATAGFRYLGTIDNVLQLGRLNLSDPPDVLMVEWEDGDDSGTIACAHELMPQAKIVLLARSVALETAQEILQLGVRGILRRRIPEEMFLKCLEAVFAGELWLEGAMVNSLLSTPRIQLSPREKQLLRLVSKGWSNKQMAYELAIAEGTVKIYLSKLFRKVGVSDRFGLALYGLRSARDIGEYAPAGHREAARRASAGR